MINLDKAMKEFKNYLQDYDLNNEMIALKVRHTYGVVNISEYIAKDLNLDDENIELAKLIGLLHDIARFEQAKEFGDYRDYKTFDHADLAIKMLFDNNLIRKFIEADKYDNIILKAIKNHNKLNIEEGLSKEELLHAKIIRDADKTDNFRVKSVETFESIFNSSKEKLENGVISDKVYNDFINNKPIMYSDVKSDIDFWVAYLSYMFDYNFNSGLKYIKEKDYVNIMIDRIDYKVKDTKEKMESIRLHSLKYIDDLINN